MIKIAVAVATADADPSAFVVWRGIEASTRKAAALGYDGVELALKSADQVDQTAFAGLLDDHGLVCPCISTGQVLAALGLHFTTRDPARRADVIRVFRGMIDLASDLGTMVNIGRVRGLVEPDEPRDLAVERFLQVARELAAYALSRDVRLVIEPVNRYETNLINSMEEGAELVERIGAQNVALMPDLFHMNIEERSLEGAIEAHAGHVAYVHFADSNRLAPGLGHTDFRALMTALRRIAYDGWISVEILPQPDPDTAAREAIEFLRPIVEEYNHGGF